MDATPDLGHGVAFFPQIAVKRREAKSKGEKERYKHLNAEFQRIARRDKRAFLRNQCKEIEENNRMGKNRDLFKKIRNTKGTSHAKMGSINNRNGMDLIEAEDIKKRWQEYTEELYKKDLYDLPLEKPVCRSGSNSENWTRNKRLVPNRKRSMSRLYIVTLLI